MPIVRTPLRDHVHAELLHRIYSGAIAPGDRLSDVTLAADLGVSRTPVREALLRLAREGVVDADVGRGFVVRALAARDVREAYPILWTLECLALRLCAPPAEERLTALERVNRDMARDRSDPERLLALDAEWHDLLLAGCPNEQLLGMVAVLKAGLRRYEHAYMRDAGRVGVSTDHHAKIVAALRRGDVDTALRWLERNWRFTMDVLVEWMSEVGGRGVEVLQGRGRRQNQNR